MTIKEDEIYIFLHIPKCAGSTLLEHIEKSFSPEEILKIYRGGKMTTDSDINIFLNSLSKERKKKIKIIYGHSVMYGMHKFFSKKGKYIIFLRNPVDRTISHYNFARTEYQKNTNSEIDPSVISAKGEILTFSEWFLKNKKLHDYMSKLLAGEFAGRLYPENIDGKIYKEVQKIINNFYFVGLVESFDKDVSYILNELGIPGQLSKTNISNKYVFANSENKKLIESKCFFDLEIYKYALSLARYNHKKIHNMPSVGVSDKKAAVFLHMYYCDLWDELRGYIKNIMVDFDLYVNLVEGSYDDKIIGKIKKDFPFANILISPNKGYDIGGFINQINNADLSKYNFICKIHTKKSPHKRTIEEGERWRKGLLSAMLGSSEIVSEILKEFNLNSKIGMAGSERYFSFNTIYKQGYIKHFENPLIKKEVNYYREICRRLNINYDIENLYFVEGTMFWCRAELAQKIKNAGFNINYFEESEERLGTKAHAFERVFGSMLKNYGYYFLGIKII